MKNLLQNKFTQFLILVFSIVLICAIVIISPLIFIYGLIELFINTFYKKKKTKKSNINNLISVDTLLKNMNNGSN